ncbi:hypothetical protein [Yoonia sp. BS5-3]|uniref:Uncharacterized protein n=1 Tax=Yoonia phaeophyticola TaxID=3137369 RepID=A0ABZ2V8Y7_9RHOB
MRGQTVEVYATSTDMLQLCKEFEESFEYNYAFLESYDCPKVKVCAEASEIDLFWTSPSGFLGRSILLVPKGDEPNSRPIKLKAGGIRYDLSPMDVDRCVVLQEGGIFAQEDCLISGRLANTFTDDWSKSVFSALSRMTKKQFKRTGSYYLGQEAKSLFDNGFRLTFQSSAPRHSDLSREA